MDEKKGLCNCIDKIKEKEKREREEIRIAKDIKERQKEKIHLLPWKSFVAMYRINPNYHGRFQPVASLYRDGV